MAKYPRVREQHIAVFGESGSGKTVLVSSFAGHHLARQSTPDALWDLVANDTGQGNRLLQNYFGMRDHAKQPMQTRFESVTYDFSIRVRERDSAVAKKWPFDVLKLAWHDYPGDWFEESPADEREEELRIDTFRSLLTSDAALLLVDGQKLLDHQGQEQRYLKKLFANVRQGLLRLKDGVLDDGQRLVEFPRIWVLALSKADLFPDRDVYWFRDLVIERAAGDIEELRRTLAEFVQEPRALSVGEDFLLLSSAKFELLPSSRTPVEIDVTERIGIDLILPIASLLPLQRRVQWMEAFDVPGKILDTMADGADALATALTGRAAAFVVGLVSKVPSVGAFIAPVAPAVVAKAAKLAGEQLRSLNETARERKDNLTATFTQFQMDLEQGVAGKIFIRSNR